MNDTIKKFWQEKHNKKYSLADWAKKPTIFAKEIIGFLPSNGKLLELGAGQGQDSRFFASHDFSVTATDIDSNSLDNIKKLIDQDELSIQCVELDISEPLPFADASFDIVFSHLALHYFDRENTQSVFSEIARVLRPNGTLAALFNTIDDPETQKEGFVELEENVFRSSQGIVKHYFSTDTLSDLTSGLFKPTLIDAQGRAYKDDIETLVRFVGNKLD